MTQAVGFCGRCRKAFVGRDRGKTVDGVVICLQCRADLAHAPAHAPGHAPRQKPAAPGPEKCPKCGGPVDDRIMSLGKKICPRCWILPDLEDQGETRCDKCGKIITRRAKANIFNGEQVLCTDCLNEVAPKPHPTRPATPRQISYLRDLGFGDADKFTFDQAHYTLDRVTSIREYMVQVASEEWGLELYHDNLKPLVFSAYSNEPLRDHMHAVVQTGYDTAFARQAAEDAEHAGEAGYQQTYIGDLVPRLPRDDAFRNVRGWLERAFHPNRGMLGAIRSFISGWHRPVAGARGDRPLLAPPAACVGRMEPLSAEAEKVGGARENGKGKREKAPATKIRPLVLITLLAAACLPVGLIALIIIALITQWIFAVGFTGPPHKPMTDIRRRLVDTSVKSPMAPDESWKFGLGDDAKIDAYVADLKSGKAMREDLLFDEGDRATLVAEMTLDENGALDEVKAFACWRRRVHGTFADSALDALDRPMAQTVSEAESTPGKAESTVLQGAEFDTLVLAIKSDSREVLLVRINIVDAREPKDFRLRREKSYVGYSGELMEALAKAGRL